jgi:hypothetical protein
MAGSNNGNGDRTVVEKISNNVYSVLIARFILPGLIALVGWFAANAFGDLKDSVKDAKTAIESLDGRVSKSLNNFDRRISLVEQNQQYFFSTSPPNNQLQRH